MEDNIKTYVNRNNEKIKSAGLKIIRIYHQQFVIFIFFVLIIIILIMTIFLILGFNDKFKSDCGDLNISIPDCPKCPDYPDIPSCPSCPECSDVLFEENICDYPDVINIYINSTEK